MHAALSFAALSFTMIVFVLIICCGLGIGMIIAFYTDCPSKVLKITKDKKDSTLCSIHGIGRKISEFPVVEVQSLLLAALTPPELPRSYNTKSTNKVFDVGWLHYKYQKQKVEIWYLIISKSETCVRITGRSVITDREIAFTILPQDYQKFLNQCS